MSRSARRENGSPQPAKIKQLDCGMFVLGKRQLRHCSTTSVSCMSRSVLMDNSSLRPATTRRRDCGAFRTENQSANRSFMAVGSMLRSSLRTATGWSRPEAMRQVGSGTWRRTRWRRRLCDIVTGCSGSACPRTDAKSPRCHETTRLAFGKPIRDVGCRCRSSILRW